MASSAFSPAGNTPAESSQLIRPSDMLVKEAPSLCDEHHDMVTIIMKGHDYIPDRKYFMHKSIACHYSPVLDKAFNGAFIEGQTQTFIMEDVKWPDTFGAVQSWMYTQMTDEWKAELLTREVMCYIWILADRLLMPKLQNEIMILLHAKQPLLGLCDKAVYENTASESKLRSYVCDFGATYRPSIAYKEHWLATEIPAELFMDIWIAKSREIPPTPENMKAEDYFVPEI